MRKPINVPPPPQFASFSPSELFRFFFQIGHWTEESFSDEFQAYTRGKLVSTVSINKWKNKDVIPTRYSGPFFKLIENVVEADLAKDWVAAFETVWALHSAGRTQNKPQPAPAPLSDTICFQHRKWIRGLYSETLTREPFAPSDIYVPLQLIECGQADYTPKDIEDVIDLVISTEERSSETDWILISGGPGSGKSMTAIHLANALCEEDIFPIYLRGSRLSNIDIDITDPEKLIADAFSMGSFLKHFRASSLKTACLILDGLDEISGTSHGPLNALNQLISSLEKEQTVCAAHDKNLIVFALGRDSHIQFASNQITSGRSKHFELLSLDGRFRNDGLHSEIILGEDLRPMWWRKYLTATGRPIDPSLPDFLTTDYDDFSEFGSDPLLTYLICRTALENFGNTPREKLPHEWVNEFTYASNKNAIYGMIVQRLADDIEHSLDSNRFLSVLQHMALATWHAGGGRSVPLKSVYDRIEDQETKLAFQSLNLSNNAGLMPAGASITAFYYRLSHDEQRSAEIAIEFTHKTFSEYLVSTLIFDRFTRLICAVDKPEDFESALRSWAALSYKGEHGPNLADFCQKEATRRYDSFSNIDWDAALEIIRKGIKGIYFEGLDSNSISQMQNASGLLYFIWSCLNLERQKRTKEHFAIPSKMSGFDTADLKSFQRPNTLKFQLGSLIEPSLTQQTFLTHSLSAIHFKSADMSQLSFSIGHIESPICEDSNFAMTHWSHVKVTKGNFIRSVFQQAIFHQWRVLESRFSDCFFQGSKFQGVVFSECELTDSSFSQCHFSDVEFLSAHMENVVFDRCVFAHCSFPRDNETTPEIGAQFRHCTFLGMETALGNIPNDNIQNTISQNITQIRQSS
ncbi:MAG: pentapeptide repeat-containing protein [Litorimonas sp.]